MPWRNGRARSGVLECPVDLVWKVVWIDYRDYPPPAWALPGAVGPLGFVSFFDIVLASFFFRFGYQLYPQLGPKLGPKSIKNRSKSPPSCIPNCILFLIVFWIDFWSIFDRFSTPKSTKNRSKINQPLTPTTQQSKIEKHQKTTCFSMFLATSAMYVVVKESIKNYAKILSKTAFKSTT